MDNDQTISRNKHEILFFVGLTMYFFIVVIQALVINQLCLFNIFSEGNNCLGHLIDFLIIMLNPKLRIDIKTPQEKE